MPGTYKIGINHVSGTSGINATLQVSTPTQGVLLTRKVEVGPVRGKTKSASPLPVMSANVTKTSDVIEVTAD